jgi:hypothetical protein
MSFFDDYEDDIVYGRMRRRVVQQRERDNGVCKCCGAHPLKVRLNHNGKWQLFEQARGEHNRNVPHVCDPTTADDFDVL